MKLSMMTFYISHIFNVLIYKQAYETCFLTAHAFSFSKVVDILLAITRSKIQVF